MKRGDTIYFISSLCILFFLFVIIINTNALAQITGGATQSVGINITIVGSLVPNLALLSPKNNTYLTNNSLLLNFTSSNAQTIWYNLDNGANTTITGFTHFNTSIEGHQLYLFANSSNGTLIGQNVNFSINETLFIIDYTEFQGALKGASSEFLVFSY